MYRIAILILTLMSCGAALAGDLRTNNSDRMMVEGSITGVKRSGGGIVIADQLYLLSPQTQVEIYTGRTGSTADLAEGMRVGCDFRIDDRQRYVLTRVRVLPKVAPSDGQPGTPGSKASR